MLSKPTLAQIAGRAYRNHPRYRDCIGHWMLGEGGGLVAFDLSGFKNDGTLTNMAPGTDWVGGPRGWTLNFDGVDNFVQIASAGVTNYPLSLCAWYQDNGFGVSQNHTIVFLGDKDTPSNYHYIATTQTTILAGSRAGGAPSNAEPSIAADTAWHHLCGVFTSATLREVYLDGVKRASNTTSLSPTGIDTTAVGRLSDSTPAEYHDGLIDDVRIYNRALDPDEIASLYTHPFLEFRPRRRIVVKAPAAAGGYPAAYFDRIRMNDPVMVG